MFRQLEPLEASRSLERKIELVVVHHMEQHEVMPALAQQLHPLEHALPIAEQVADEHDEPAAREGFGERTQHGLKRGLPVAPGRLEHFDDARELRPLRGLRAGPYR